MSAIAPPGSGKLLVEMVSDVCRIEGFTIEKNVEAEKNTGNFLDIVASRRSGRKRQKIAFECWEREAQATAKEIESFVRRLRDLNIRHGIYVSPKGFTGDAEFVAKQLSVELWDLVKLKQHLTRIKTPHRTKVPGTLPVSKTLSLAIFSPQLANAKVLRMSSLPRLEFRPYFFAKFDAKGGRKSSGRGVLVLDGVDGRVCDAGVLDGRLERLPSTGLFVDCLGVEPSVGHLPKLPDELGMSNTVTIAPAGIAKDHVRTMVGDALQKDAGIDPGEVNVTDVIMLHVPIVTVELRAGEKSYRKVVQAATGKMIWDETAKCLFCEHGTRAICEVCGGTVCPEHLRLCSSCRKHLCTECVTTKGVVSKRDLCPSCKRS